MKNTLYLTLLAAALLAPAPLHAAQQYSTQQEAAKSVTDDGYILVAYAKGWDRFSEPHCKKIVQSEEIMKAAGDAAVILTPFYQYATADDKEKQAAVWGALVEPRSNSRETYPCMLMYDKKGYLYGRIQGEVFLRGSMADIAAEVKKKLEQKREQDKIMAQAESASGPEKAILIAKACDFKDIERPDGHLEMAKAADPSDQSGMVKRLSFYPWGFSHGNFGEDAPEVDTESFIKKMEAMAKDPVYTPEQQQVFYAQCIGKLRRESGDNSARIKHYAAEMKKLAPDSHLGVSADQAVKIWASGKK